MLFDFERAQKALSEAVDGVLANDFFLGEFKDEFLDCARFLVSEAYVRIHGRVDIECVVSLAFVFITLTMYRNLSERLNLSQEEGEKWIVNLIRESRMGTDAKIDLEKVRVFPMSNFVY